MTESRVPPVSLQSVNAEPKAGILLVDDSRANLLALRAILEALGQDLVEVRSGEEALERARSEEYAVILLDVFMPGTDGFETARQLRILERSRHTPIIFLTAHNTDQAQLETAYALGVVDFLIKPLVPVVLRAKVQSFVDVFQEKQRAKQEAEQLRLLVHGTTEYAIFLLDPEGHIASWNSGAERIKQYRAGEIIGQHFSRFYPQDAIDRGWPDYELRVASAEGRFEDEGWRIRKDGSQFWANVVITALKDEAGNLRGFSKITRDMTDKKRAEENARRLVEETTARRVAEENAQEIQEQRERLRVTLASIGDAVISTDAEGRIHFLNPVAEQLVGWKADEAVGQPLAAVFRIIDEDSRQAADNPALEALRQGKVVGLRNHTVLIAKNGAELSIDDSAAPIRDSEGRIIGSVLVFRDISERRRAQQALHESESRFRQLADAMPQIVWTASADGQIEYLNRRWNELTGLANNLGSAGWTQIIHRDDAQGANERWAASLKTGEPLETEMRLLDQHTHAYRWHLIRTVAVRDAAGNVSRWFGTGTDIHAQKRAGESFQFLAEASATLARVVDYESTLQKVAKMAIPAFADWSVVDVTDDSGKPRRIAVAHQDPEKFRIVQELMDLYPRDPESPGGVDAVLRSGKSEIVSDITDEMLERGAKDERHLALVRSLGLRSMICVPLMVSGKPLGAITFATAESGRAYGAADLAIAEDLARRAAVAVENTRLYQALRETDRRKDEFLATLAHELRNPLAPIRNSLQILKMPRVDAETMQQTRDMMERQVHHLVRLVDDLLDVSRVMRGKVELRREPVELASVIARAVETAKPLIEAHGQQLDLSVADESMPLNADPVRIVQAIGNLLNNAAKYTEPLGQIWLTVRKEDDWAILSVRDNGIGIAPDMLPHVFELFVQADDATARAQGGLGIGLTLVKNLVELHGGSVEAKSAGLGAGAEFRVRLPLSVRARESQPASGGSEQQQEPARSGYRVLVVDDNHDAAISLAMLLRLQGHEVRVAHDGTSALEVANRFRPKIIFLDLGMPGMDGYEVARRIRQTAGLENTILAALTGWGQQEDRRRTAEAGFNHHLVKPPEPDVLERLMEELQQAN